MPAKTFYGSVDPALALKVLQKQSAPRPTLKGAFTAKPPSTLEPTEQPQPKKTTCEKQCTGHFGCSNLAVFKEASSFGNLNAYKLLKLAPFFFSHIIL